MKNSNDLWYIGWQVDFNVFFFSFFPFFFSEQCNGTLDCTFFIDSSKMSTSAAAAQTS